MIKKFKIIILVTIVSLIGIIKFSGIDQLIMFILINKTTKKLNNFDKNKDNYHVISNKVISLWKSGKIAEENNSLMVSQGELLDVYENNKFRKIKLSNNEKNSLLGIEKTFDEADYPMENIEYYYDNYVAFTHTTYLYFGVIYSKNGNEPTRLGDLNIREKGYKLKKIDSNWYTVEDK